MLLHKRYDQVRSLLDGRFQGFCRRAAGQGLDMDRMELWHDLLEAALLADRDWPDAQEAETEAWAVFILERVEAHFGTM